MPRSVADLARQCQRSSPVRSGAWTVRCSAMAVRFGPCLRWSSNCSSDCAKGALQALIGCYFGRLILMHQTVSGLLQVSVFAATAVRFSMKSSSFSLFIV